MSLKTLLVYQKEFDLAMDSFHLAKDFLKPEMFELTSQMGRSSRSVCFNMVEGYKIRQYDNHFKSKLSDTDSENAEPQLWFGFAFACEYISESTNKALPHKSEEIGKRINYMMNNTENSNKQIESDCLLQTDY